MSQLHHHPPITLHFCLNYFTIHLSHCIFVSITSQSTYHIAFLSQWHHNPPITLHYCLNFITIYLSHLSEIFISSIPSSGSGVFAKKVMEQGTLFGPYRGIKVSRNVDKQAVDTSYMWEVSVHDNLTCKIYKWTKKDRNVPQKW